MGEADHYAKAPDGLRIHYRDLGPANADALPLVCLPGLTRTVDDFDVLARRIAVGEAPRRVVVVEYRGRGESDRDPDPSGYNVEAEAGDVMAVLDATGIGEAVILGTSRGGLIAFVLAALRPELVRGVVLNDIGTVLEPAGLERIRGYVSKLPLPANWNEAVATAKASTGSDFTHLTDEDWLAFAGLTFTDREGAFALRYDPALMESLKDLDLADLPDLWEGFPALHHAPLLVIRGDNSDLLSRATADDMVRRHPDAALFRVPNQGHAPLLRDAPTIERITAFVRRCDVVRRCDGVRHAAPDIDAGPAEAATEPMPTRLRRP